MRTIPALSCLASLFLACVAAPAAELRLDARALLDRSVSHNVRLSADGQAIELEEGELFEDDGPAAGYSYRPNEERLSDRVWIRKELLVPNPAARSATLLVGPGGAFKAIVNDTPAELRRLGKAGNYWEAYALPPNVLKAGRNAIVLHGAGKVWVARADEFPPGSSHPNRSARSSDAGQSWDSDHLGPAGNIDGEYYVRLFLDHYRSSGSLRLPVLDAANLAGEPIGAPAGSAGPLRIRIEATAGSHRARSRSGPTPLADGKDWSAWHDLGSTTGTTYPLQGRYFQLAVDLSTSDPLQTPRLTAIVFEAPPAEAAWTARVKLRASHNEEIVRSSLPFAYEPFDHPRLKSLREKYRLDDLVRSAENELELVSRLARWSARMWEKGHLKESYPPWDALEILKPHTDGTPIGGFCQQYNLVFLQVCESFGLVGRAVSLGVGDHGGKVSGGGHEVVEIWSNQFGKWIYVDGNMAWYAVDAGSGVPLSLRELRSRQLRTLRGERAEAIRVIELAEMSRRWTGLEVWPPFLELRLIPRSNFLEQSGPLPLNQGMRGWFWTGHHAWTDADYPASLLYGHRVSERRNWDWTLNQAHYYLEATTTPGELRVHLDTVTPGLDTFLADIDGSGERPVASSFLWKLHEGKNRLEVRPRNSAGRKGLTSWIVLEHP